MFKMPEPAGRIAAELGNTNHIRTIPYYTESQLKQFACDALEEAALLFNQLNKEYFGRDIQDEIRKLKEGL